MLRKTKKTTSGAQAPRLPVKREKAKKRFANFQFEKQRQRFLAIATSAYPVALLIIHLLAPKPEPARINCEQI